MVCGYFVSPIFVDMLVLLFAVGAGFEMRRCLKQKGYDMYLAPLIIMLVCSYPAFYLMQHFMGEGVKVSAGLQGLLIVFLVSIVVTLTTFTFRPLSKKFKAAETENAENSDIISNIRDRVDVNFSVNIKDADGDTALSITKKNKPNDINNLFANVFLLVYPIVFLTVGWVVSYKYSGIFSILFAVLVTIIGSDTFAYFCGSLLGKKKLCPSISPKKTVAGAIGGVIGGMVLAIIMWLAFEYSAVASDKFAAGCFYKPFIPHSDGGWMWKSSLIYLALGLICGAVAELGDLAASSIKRALGIKDYGKIFPGHGGIMDRIDSVLYTLVELLIAFSIIYGY